MNNKTEIRITVEEDANGCAVRVDMDGSAKGIVNGLGAAVNDFCEGENIPLPVFFAACVAGKAHDLKKSGVSIRVPNSKEGKQP